MRYIFAIMITALFLLFPSHAFTQVKEIVSEGAYNMGDGETPSVAESRALLNAKRIALEQAGTYVESHTKVESFQLTKDEIQVLASGIMEVEILEKKRTVVGEGFRFWVKIKARVNPDKIQEMAKKVKDKSVVDDYKKIQEAYDKSQREIEELKRQLAKAKGVKEKKQVEAKITDDERMFQANEWFEKGIKYWRNQQFDEAIEAYTSAITLNPNYAEAYSNRGLIYSNKGQHDRAIEDCNKAIALNPNDAEAYNIRGIAYNGKGQYDKAINDYTKALELDPNKAFVYYYNSSIAYDNRGAAYYEKGQYDRAIADFNKVIALNPNYAEAYHNRGLVYNDKGQYDRAIEDYNKAIAINPNLAAAYGGRGAAYANKGIMGKAISDFQKACDMGDEYGCNNLQKALQKR